MRINAILWIEVDADTIDNPAVMGALDRLAAEEAASRRLMVVRRHVTHSDSGPGKIVVWDTKPAS